jgi:hypothetical protein
MKALILSLLCLITLPAWAEEPVVDVQLCREMVSHTPRDDVTFKPGVGANGKTVAPADLQTSQDYNFLKQIHDIPLSVDLAKRLSLSVTGLEMQTALPPLQIRPDGRIFWNGQDITQQATYYCEGQGNVPPMVIRPEAGQK